MASYRSRSVGSRSPDGRDGQEPEDYRPQPGPSPRRAKKSKLPPQQVIDEFWASFNSRTPGRISTVLPNNYYAKSITQRPDADEWSHNAVESYKEAARICMDKVEKIVKECRRVNQKYRDPHFDIEHDFYRRSGIDCLSGLLKKNNETELEPKSVRRVADIFEKPQFFIEGATANDVKQGKGGDCWLMSALSTISNRPGLISTICVAQDESVGVYGFVFHRDGAWISEVVDDKLYLLKEDFYDHDGEIDNWLEIQNPKDIENEYKKRFQTGSKALYFAQCSDPNETWLPLLEKAFAKAHGDYKAIEGGFVGEAIEDMTGGVTSEVHGTDILDRDAFWRNELMQVNKQFLFGCGQARGKSDDRKGILHRHAYSIMEAREVEDDVGVKRLLKLRNPWGDTEWNGAWSDGSEEWTPYWMEKLGHRFGNDGVFWISYDDLLNVYQHFDRTRLFDEDWHVTQQWISLSIPWSIDYHDNYFKVEVTRSGPLVVVLSQLDGRYFRGLEGQYTFSLQFRLHKEGESDYLVRSPSSYSMRRSVSTEVDLEPGVYRVMIKIVATFQPNSMPTEDLVKAASRDRREKLLAIGLSHDLAHAKGQVKEHEQQEKQRETQRRRVRRKADARAAFEARRKASIKAEDLARKRTERVNASRRARSERQSMQANNGTRAGPLPELSSDANGGVPVETGGAEEGRENGMAAAPTPLPPSESSNTGDGRDAAPSDVEHAQEGAADISQDLLAQQADRSTGVAMESNEQHLPIRSRQEELGQPGETAPLQRVHTESTYGPPPGAQFMQHSFGPGTPQPLPPPPECFPGPMQDGVNEGDLSWDSELDAPPDTDDERMLPTFPKPVAAPPADADDEFAGEPWNAVCVVGLRVYAKTDNDITVEVVRPGMSDTGAKQATEKKGLDTDDPAVDQAEQGAIA